MLKTLGEKKGYSRAIRILEEEKVLRENMVLPEDLRGFMLALNLLRLYSGREFPGEKKWKGAP